jgi:hypothetical protein
LIDAPGLDQINVAKRRFDPVGAMLYSPRSIDADAIAPGRPALGALG